MTDTSFNIQDEIVFIAINIRNRGSMYMNNGMRKHILTGEHNFFKPILARNSKFKIKLKRRNKRWQSFKDN
jgi:hypothetical protein